MTELFTKGGPLMYPILLLSVLSLTITFERIIFWLREKKKTNTKLMEEILEEAKSGNFKKAIVMGEACQDSVIKVIVNGLTHRDISMRDSLELAAYNEIDRMKKGIAILDTIISMAPLLGILGTVLGIIQSFEFMGVSGAENPKVVTAGIAQALITTAAGLSVAIATLAPYNYFTNKLQETTRKMEKSITSFEIAYQKGMKKNETSK